MCHLFNKSIVTALSCDLRGVNDAFRTETNLFKLHHAVHNMSKNHWVYFGSLGRASKTTTILYTTTYYKF